MCRRTPARSLLSRSLPMGSCWPAGGPDGTVRRWEPSSRAALRILRSDRRYERLDITGLTGVTAAQRSALLTLRAVDHEEIVDQARLAAGSIGGAGGHRVRSPRAT